MNLNAWTRAMALDFGPPGTVYMGPPFPGPSSSQPLNAQGIGRAVGCVLPPKRSHCLNFLSGFFDLSVTSCAISGQIVVPTSNAQSIQNSIATAIGADAGRVSVRVWLPQSLAGHCLISCSQTSTWSGPLQPHQTLRTARVCDPDPPRECRWKCSAGRTRRLSSRVPRSSALGSRRALFPLPPALCQF